MRATEGHPVTAPATDNAAKPIAESVLPELRTMWRETGMRARASAGAFAVFAQLPRLVATAIRISWRADRVRTLIVAAATTGSGIMATFGLLATQRVLVQLFEGGPTTDRLSAALPALAALAAVTAGPASFGIITGYAHNGLTHRADREVKPSLFEVTKAVRVYAFD